MSYLKDLNFNEIKKRICPCILSQISGELRHDLQKKKGVKDVSDVIAFLSTVLLTVVPGYFLVKVKLYSPAERF